MDMTAHLAAANAHIPLTPQPRQPYTLDPHQEEALAAVRATWGQGSLSCQLISASGSGKTITMFEIAKAESAKTVVFFLPGLALITQTIDEWMTQSGAVGINALCVCSDRSAGLAPRRRRGDSDFDELEDYDVRNAVTTSDPEDIAEHIAAAYGRMTVIFSTYDSAHHIIAAQQLHGAPAFDIAFMDEAHHLVSETKNVPYGELVKDKPGEVGGDQRLRAVKRLYATATPKTSESKKVRDGVDRTKANYQDFMDSDSPVYGPYAYKLSLGQAIQRDILVDYTVSVIAVTAGEAEQLAAGTPLYEDGEVIPHRFLAAREAIRRAHEAGARRFLTYQSRLDASKKFAELMSRSDGVPNGRHVRGTDNAATRHDVIDELKRLPGDSGRADGTDGLVVTNVQCLSEGVDVPALDAVVFIDAKHAVVDIMQSIGRALRKNRDKTQTKTHGRIILIAYVPAELESTGLTTEQIDAIVQSSGAFKSVWSVLDALEKNDELVHAMMGQTRVGNSLGRGGPAVPIIDPDGAPPSRRGLSADEAAAGRGSVVSVHNGAGNETELTRQLMRSIRLISAQRTGSGRKDGLTGRDKCIIADIHAGSERVAAGTRYDRGVRIQEEISIVMNRTGKTRDQATAEIEQQYALSR